MKEKDKREGKERRKIVYKKKEEEKEEDMKKHVLIKWFTPS